MDERGSNRKLRLLQKLFLLLLFACLLLMAARIRGEERRSFADSLSHIAEDAVRASVQSGFYDEELYVTLDTDAEVPQGAKIRYTLNGDDPSGRSDVYTDGLTLPLPEGDAAVYPLKARIFYKDDMSSVFRWTYVVGQGVEERFNLPVISITCNFHDLYSYEEGILTDGISKDIARVMGRSTYAVGNYFQRGEEWTKQAHVTVFSPDGEELLEQGAGLAISGGSSRSLKTKSFKLTAGEPYDLEHEKFRLNFFQDTESSEFSYVNEFTNLKLRMTESRMRAFSGELGEKLAEQSGFAGYQFSRPAILFLNGSFYSLVDLMPSFSNSYLAHRFGLTNAFDVVKEKKVESNVLDALYDTVYFEADLTEEKNRKALEQRVDMDDYLLYCAIQVLINNTDWPRNNFEAWRYGGYRDGASPYMDGRARFLLYDLDFIYSRGSVSEEERGTDVFENLMEGIHFAEQSQFSHVMEAKEYRDRFVTIVADLLNTSFDSENVKSLMEQIYIEKRNEAVLRYGEDDDTRNLYYIMDAEETAENRAQEMAAGFEKYFDLTETYKAKILCDEGVGVRSVSVSVAPGETYSCEYYKGVEAHFEAEAAPGYHFLHWLVNGKKVEGSSIVLDGSSLKKGLCEVRAVAARVEGPKVLIAEVSAKSDSDWIRIKNAGSEAADLKHLWLSDREDEPLFYHLPDIQLQSGESVTINGKKNYYALGDYICNFNLSSGETLCLYDEEAGEFLDTLVIPRMSSDETYGRAEDAPGFLYYNNLDERRKQQ